MYIYFSLQNLIRNIVDLFPYLGAATILVTVFWVKKIATTKNGRTKEYNLGEDKTQHQAAKIIASDSNKYEFEETILHKHPEGQDFSGKTKGGTWLTWLTGKEEKLNEK